MTPEQKRLKAVFETWDSDGNGTISRLELEKVFTKLGMLDGEQISAMMDAVDRNDDGEIQYDEFVGWVLHGEGTALMSEQACFDLELALKPLFKIYDQDGSDVISRKEFSDCHSLLQATFKRVKTEGMPDMSALMTTYEDRVWVVANKDQDEGMSFDEFVGWFRDSIEHSGLDKDRFTALVQTLATLLNSIFAMSTEEKRRSMCGIAAGEEHQYRSDPVMDSILQKAGEIGVELFTKKNHRRPSKPEGGDDSARFDVWYRIPQSLSMEQLANKHLEDVEKLPGQLQASAHVEMCMPETAGAGPPGGGQRWLARLIRTSIFRTRVNGVAPGEPVKEAHFYVLQDDEWRSLPDGTTFDETLKALPWDLKLYAMLLTAANFGQSVAYSKVEEILNHVINLGFITREDFMEFNSRIEQALLVGVTRQMQKDTPDDETDLATRRAKVIQQLQRVTFAPEAVMSQLVACDVAPARPMWSFSTSRQSQSKAA